MGVELQAGAGFRSVACDGGTIVVGAATGEVVLRGGGHPAPGA